MELLGGRVVGKSRIFIIPRALFSMNCSENIMNGLGWYHSILPKNIDMTWHSTPPQQEAAIATHKASPSWSRRGVSSWGRIRGPQGPGPVIRQGNLHPLKTTPPTTEFLATCQFSGCSRRESNRNTVSVFTHKFKSLGRILLEWLKPVVMAGNPYPVCHFNAWQSTARRFRPLATFFLSHAGWMAKMPLPSS